MIETEECALEDRWLAEATRRLLSEFDPDLVMLFGSRARRTATRKSDLDLLVVCETMEGPLERIGHVLQLLGDSPWPVEALVYTPSELRAISERPLIRRILREGRVLYERRAA